LLAFGNLGWRETGMLRILIATIGAVEAVPAFTG
jgi:hypothetical protein